MVNYEYNLLIFKILFISDKDDDNWLGRIGLDFLEPFCHMRECLSPGYVIDQ